MWWRKPIAIPERGGWDCSSQPSFIEDPRAGQASCVFEVEHFYKFLTPYFYTIFNIIYIMRSWILGIGCCFARLVDDHTKY
jgi:hypothetical protein